MVEKVAFAGRILMLGFGSVGQCTLPVIPRHFDMPVERISVIDADDHEAQFAPFEAMGMRYLRVCLTPENLEGMLAQHAGPGDLIINLTAGVDAISIMDWCQHRGVLYVDTSLEPWAELYEDASLPPWKRTHYESHEVTRARARSHWRPDGPTCIVTHGANPGMVNHFVKEALLTIAERTGTQPASSPKTRAEWAALAQGTGTKVIHIAERDTQRSSIAKHPDEFVNTWSVLGYWGEAYYPAELGWGSHEKMLPPKAQHFTHGPGNCIYMLQPGGQTLVRSWVPDGGPIYGFVISHSESVTLSDYFTAYDNGRPVYRPTVHYAYHPTTDAIASLRELMMRDWQPVEQERIMQDDIVDGMDELGVLLMGHGLGAYWYGSQLSIQEAREIIPGQNATAVQVVAGVISAAVWAARNPRRGYCEPEALPHDEILAIARPYLGPMVGVESDWTPLKDRTTMFPEPWLDRTDPWQFSNFLLRT
ncbi:homospermidine synthase [Aliidongia dinghuensis]|uniref:Homospermidine synthase n=1 Tax=Aliidongia dinghuensis TaxID=1867774 RepID=A0A8J2YTT5_9PROT|nr:saccharopine dehydrogenase C-terminal domain-containing protein [Aliidongia dinghuensis]GGF17121.1 homospermidine synthase [Aliidongia dinghuensis]